MPMTYVLSFKLEGVSHEEAVPATTFAKAKALLKEKHPKATHVKVKEKEERLSNAPDILDLVDMFKSYLLRSFTLTVLGKEPWSAKLASRIDNQLALSEQDNAPVWIVHRVCDGKIVGVFPELFDARESILKDGRKLGITEHPVDSETIKFTEGDSDKYVIALARIYFRISTIL